MQPHQPNGLELIRTVVGQPPERFGPPSEIEYRGIPKLVPIYRRPREDTSDQTRSGQT
jgi:hypothetical protein